MKSVVSIIIPNYNQSNYITECINSVKSQSFTDFECVVYDDCSTDNSLSIIENLTSNDRRFSIYKGKVNKGLAHARNTAITKAEGRYILPLDSDDYISSNFLQEAVHVLEHNKKVKIVVPSIQMFDAINKKIKFSVITEKNIIIEASLPHCCMFRKSDFLNTDGYDPRFIYSYEDMDFWISFWLKNNLSSINIACLNDICFYYRRRRDSKSLDTLRDKEKLAFTRNLMLEKYPELYKPNSK
jgi:glycosyltransferase involved in cell wall biosynthesis